MYILIGAVAFIAGIVLSTAVLIAVRRAQNARFRKGRRAAEPPNGKRKFEFVKIILLIVLFTYFIGVYIGARIVLIDFSQLGVLLAFIGTPTATAIGFYCWKAKAENTIKLKKDNPKETQGIPVDLNNVNN